MIVRENKTIMLDVRAGSFCIYRKETFVSICCGDVDSFRTHEHMRKYSIEKFEAMERVK